MKTADPTAAAWQRLAARTARKVNFGWWLERMLPLIIAGSVLAFAVIFWLRSRGDVLGWQQVWPWTAGACAAAGLGAWFLARRQFVSRQQALVRLESQLHLHNALTAASAGVAPWPAVPAQIADGWTWRWERVGGPFLLVVVSLIGALWIPVSLDAEQSLPTVEPQAWQQMEQWLEQLKKEEIVPPEEAKEEEQKISELREQPKEKWFSHESLNASDTLKEQLQRDIQNLAQNMANAERTLNALQNYADQLSAETKDVLVQQFDEAIKGLQGSDMKLDAGLMKELAQIDPKNLKSLSQEQLDQMREALKKKSGSCNGMCKNPGFLGDGEGEDDALAEMLKQLQEQQGEKEGPKGGITRGPGTAPVTLSDDESRFGTGKNESVTSTDMSRALPGDMIGLQNGKHEVDKDALKSRDAGSVKDAGSGGEQVWKESLTPEEKAVLKRVFK
ncbi:MAG: hypothetical protein JNG86_00035 [Verrucomicrobiaceae bacterium]|nr:hypothetical protein [Verrucomicrobiaceae bacterium]